MARPSRGGPETLGDEHHLKSGPARGEWAAAPPPAARRKVLRARRRQGVLGRGRGAREGRIAAGYVGSRGVHKEADQPSLGAVPRATGVPHEGPLAGSAGGATGSGEEHMKGVAPAAAATIPRVRELAGSARSSDRARGGSHRGRGRSREIERRGAGEALAHQPSGGGEGSAPSSRRCRARSGAEGGSGASGEGRTAEKRETSTISRTGGRMTAVCAMWWR